MPLNTFASRWDLIPGILRRSSTFTVKATLNKVPGQRLRAARDDGFF